MVLVAQLEGRFAGNLAVVIIDGDGLAALLVEEAEAESGRGKQRRSAGHNRRDLHFQKSRTVDIGWV